jgi:hypothetical protein
MTTEEKYERLLMHLGVMIHHPFPNNYYATFAAFADDLPDEILRDVEMTFKQSAQYRMLLAKKTFGGIGDVKE